MNLVEGFVELAERSYAIDWHGIQRAVAARLRLTSPFDSSVCDPRRYPTYWCVPPLVGSYAGASRPAVLADTEAFVSGCVMRHCMFAPERPFDAAAGGADFRAIAAAYDGCRVVNGAPSPFEDRFAAKCRPWRLLLEIGTRSIAAEAGDQADYQAAMRAIVRVYSCLQLVDDWHDADEDTARGHWNMWAHEPVRDSLSAIEPLLRGSRAAVDRLRPHLLRRALDAQLRDAAHDLARVVSAQRRNGRVDDAISAGIAFLHARAATERSGLWRDFTLPGRSAGSTECVSAFVAAQIAAIPDGRELAAGVVEPLASRARASGGWGYREDVPEDCDSTAWVLLAAAAAGVELPPPLVERSGAFIAGHQRPDGGFATYGPAARESLTPADQPGWFEPDVSVTASAVLALAAAGHAGSERLDRASGYLLRNCRDGLWESYWWSGFGYATYLALLALAEAGALSDAQLAATRRALLRRRAEGGGWGDERGTAANGFVTSFALRALLLARPADGPAVDDAMAYLAGLIGAGGGAPASAAMLAPGALAGGDLMLRDSGVVTTACVVRALHDAAAGRQYGGRTAAATVRSAPAAASSASIA